MSCKTLRLIDLESDRDVHNAQFREMEKKIRLRLACTRTQDGLSQDGL